MRWSRTGSTKARLSTMERIAQEERDVNKIRIGVVGPGLIWKRAHKPALDLVGERAIVTAFSASSEKTRREVEQAYPGVPFYADYHDLVASPEVDWVLVLTPIALNAPVARPNAPRARTIAAPFGAAATRRPQSKRRREARNPAPTRTPAAKAGDDSTAKTARLRRSVVAA